MNLVQTPPLSEGVCVFGSATLRATPDLAVFDFAVTRVDESPRRAIAAANAAAQRVRDYADSKGLHELTWSIATSNPRFERVDGVVEQVGHTGRVNFVLTLRNTQSREEVLLGLREAGVDVVRNVDLQSSELRQLRNEARVQATQAAREKAEVYCQAAGVQLGEVRSIEDLDPNSVPTYQNGHVRTVLPSHPGDSESSSDTILVTAAVRLLFAIAPPRGAA